MRFFLGGDPGKTGAIALLKENDDCSFSYDIDRWEDGHPGNIRLIKDAYRFMRGGGFVQAVVEKVFAQVRVEGDRVINAGAKASFTFGKVFGQMIQSFIVYEIPLNLWTPQEWMVRVNIPEAKWDNKPAHIETCKRLIPGSCDVLKLKKDHDVADALLIAYTNMRSWQGEGWRKTKQVGGEKCRK